MFFYTLVRTQVYRKFSRFITSGKLYVSPSCSLVTDELEITGSGFPPQSALTIQCNLECSQQKLNFQSFAHIETPEDGSFDLAQTESTGGSYTGCDPMGLLWSMESVEGFDPVFRVSDASSPFNLLFNIYQGHNNIMQSNPSQLCSVKAERWFLKNGVRREPVSSGHVRGTLFVPPGEGPFPAIITLYGANKKKGVVEDAAALLANEGFVTLALAYFGIDGLPKTYSVLDIEYFEEALEFLSSLPVVDDSHVGLWGSSKGGDVAFAIMEHLSRRIKSFCVVNGCIASIGGITQYKGKITPQMPSIVENITTFDEGLLNIRDATPDPRDYPDSIHLFEQSSSYLLMVVAVDDYNWNSELFADIAKDKMDKVGKTNYEILKLAGMCHNIGAPFVPPCSVSGHALLPPGTWKVYFGGRDKQAHNEASSKMWREVISFFKRTLVDILKL